MVDENKTLDFHSQLQRSGQVEGIDVSFMFFYIYGLLVSELASTSLAYK